MLLIEGVEQLKVFTGNLFGDCLELTAFFCKIVDIPLLMKDPNELM